MGWAHEWSSDLQEVLEVAVFISGASWSGDFGLVFSEGVSEDLDPSVVRDGLSFSEGGDFGLDSLIEVVLHLVFEWGLSGISEFLGFDFSLEFLVVDLVVE